MTAPGPSSSLKLPSLYRGLVPDSEPWVEGLQSLHPSLILAQGTLALTKSGFTQIYIQISRLLGFVSLFSVRAQLQLVGGKRQG